MTTKATTCPTCHRSMSARRFHPTDQVVLGLVEPGAAPILAQVWADLQQALTRADTPLPQRQLVLGIAALRGYSPKTIENMIHAAVKHGLIQRTYRTGGTPKRRRAYIATARPPDRERIL